MFLFKRLMTDYLYRLPVFIVAYSLLLLISKDDSAAYAASLLAVFTLPALMDLLVSRRLIVAAVCVVACAVFIYFRNVGALVVALCSVLYRPQEYSGFVSMLWIVALCGMTAVGDAIGPAIRNICIRNVLLTAVINAISHVSTRLDIFLHSSYCRTVSKKTAAALVARICKLVLPCLAAVVAAVFLALLPSYPEIVMPEVALPTDMPRLTPIPLLEIEVSAEPFELVFDELLMLEEPAEEADDAPRSAPVALIVIIVCALVAILIAYIVHRESIRDTERFSEDDEDELEEPAASDSRSRNRRKWLNLGVNYAVRRMFRLKVREYAKRGLLSPVKSDTPKQLAGIIAEFEDVETLQRLYHKARYSGTDVTRAQLREMNSKRNDG